LSIDEGEAQDWQLETDSTIPSTLIGDVGKAKKWGVLSLIAFFFNVVVNGLTYVVTLSVPSTQVLLLVLSAIPFSAMIVFPKPVGLYRHLVSTIPWVAVLLWFSVVVYAVMSYVIVGDLLQHGHPAEDNGKFVLRAGGQQIRVLTKEEYDQCVTLQVRRFSGILMVFSVLSTVFFWFYPSACTSEKALD
jgi:hypothetical protein